MASVWRRRSTPNTTPPPTRSEPRHLHCNNEDCPIYQAEKDPSIYQSDKFRMYSFKVVLCHKNYTHDWTSCPYTHIGERARRRDPNLHLPVMCPFFKDNDTCKQGDECVFAHGLFEYWLHPGKYRTIECTNGQYCYRKVCFFAHSPQELRPEQVLSSDEIYSAFSSNMDTPVTVAPRRVLRSAVTTPPCTNNNTISTTLSATQAISAPAYPNLGTNLCTAGGEGVWAMEATYNYKYDAGPSNIVSSMEYSEDLDLSSLPYNLSGLYELLQEMDNEGEASTSTAASTWKGKEKVIAQFAPVATLWDNYQMWN